MGEMGEKKKQSAGIAEDPKTLEKLNADLRAKIQERVRTEKALRGSEEGRFLGTYGVARSITDNRRAEEQLGKTCRKLQETRDLLLQSEKLAALGRLMSGGASFFIQLPVLRNKES